MICSSRMRIKALVDANFCDVLVESRDNSAKRRITFAKTCLPSLMAVSTFEDAIAGRSLIVTLLAPVGDGSIVGRGMILHTKDELTPNTRVSNKRGVNVRSAGE